MGGRAEAITVSDIAAAIHFEETEKGGRYFVAMPNGEQARLTYVEAGASHIIADHTFVPVPYRSKGVAQAMAARLIADARKSGLRITPTCWFVADEFKRHDPDWDDLLQR
jgi:predicted GNAT family acetyltransferase